MTLTGKQKHHLRGLAHGLKPVVMIGDKGLSENVLAEIEGALAFHELIKVKFPAVSKEIKTDWINTVCQAYNAEHVQSIGRIVVFFKPSDKQKINLP